MTDILEYRNSSLLRPYKVLVVGGEGGGGESLFRADFAHDQLATGRAD